MTDQSSPVTGQRLTPAERAFLNFLGTQLGQVASFQNLKPSTRSMVKRLRRKGILSKRDTGWVRMTELGKNLR
jgi:hypothetical protein